jgi:hypothetical protein
MVDNANGKASYIHQGLMMVVEQALHLQGYDNQTIDKNAKAFERPSTVVYALDHIYRQMRTGEADTHQLSTSTKQNIAKGYQDYFYEKALDALGSKQRAGWRLVIEESLHFFADDGSLDSLKTTRNTADQLVRRRAIEQGISKQVKRIVEDRLDENLAVCFLTDDKKPINCSGLFVYAREKMKQQVEEETPIHPEDGKLFGFAKQQTEDQRLYHYATEIFKAPEIGLNT